MSDENETDVVQGEDRQVTPGPYIVVNEANWPMTVRIGMRTVVIPPGESRTLHNDSDEETHDEWRRLNDETG